MCGRKRSQSNNRHIDDESDDDRGSVDERNRIIKEYSIMEFIEMKINQFVFQLCVEALSGIFIIIHNHKNNDNNNHCQFRNCWTELCSRFALL